MKKIYYCILLLQVITTVYGQKPTGTLTVEKIMQGPKWIGTSPANPYWSADNKFLLFNWNPEKATNDSLYYITATSLTPQKTTYDFRKQVVSANAIRYNTLHTGYVYSDNGDIFYADVKT